MTRPDSRRDDPIVWCVLIALGFLAVSLHRLALPSITYFDEVHYVEAARLLLELSPTNREHPLFAKQIIAAFIALMGDQPLAWRLPGALLGAAGLFAFGRLVWHLSGQRAAALLAMALMATNFLWFVQSRIAMLDIYAASLALIGLWLFVAATGNPRPRPRLIAAGLALGLAIGSKWSVAPVVVLPGLAWLVLKARRGPEPIGISKLSLFEAALWLGLFPLAIYWLTYSPAFFYPEGAGPVSPFGFLELHREMIALQGSVTQAHTYQSRWWQWAFNLRPIWYLYEHVDGAQRGILMLGNPLTMIAGLPALGWCLWQGLVRRRTDALAMAVLYAASLGLWIIAGKPVQFFYHYLLPGTFLMGCLALAMASLWDKSRAIRASCIGIGALSATLFVWFHPILSAAPLSDGRMAFEKWMWLASWH